MFSGGAMSIRDANTFIKILESERELYSELYRLERIKEKAILDRDGTELEKISSSEEAVLNRALAASAKRDEFIRGISGGKTGMRLSEVISSFFQYSEKVFAAGESLKSEVDRLKRLQSSNNKMLEDSIGYFRAMIDGLKNSSRMNLGYGRNGWEDYSGKNSVIFNKTA
jgi:hypothetical protein